MMQRSCDIQNAMRVMSRALFFGLTSIIGNLSYGQLSVNSQTDLQQLAEAISGPGVRITNPTIDCHGQGYGEFTYTGTAMDLDQGVLLTTGTITNAIGPNTVSNRTFEQNRPGNAILNTVTGRTTFDACRFEFDIIPSGDTLQFNFSFASEEYNEWVGSQYNDVFGFFISGPGIVGDPGIGNDKNIALIPGTSQAVTINTVNNGSNQDFHTDNTGGSQIQYDGLTNDLSALAAVVPCQTYRLKLIVADASDRKFDSGVFIERIESNAVTMSATTANGLSDMVEGCNAGLFTFTRQGSTAMPLEVPYFLAGTAINGTDYPLIGSDPDPLVAKMIIIPAGSTSATVTIDPMADGITEQAETLRVYLGNSVCPGSYIDSLELVVRDTLPATVSNSSSICSGSSILLNATGGLNYGWSPSTGLNDPSSATPLASPSTTTTYTAQVVAGNCIATLGTTITVSNMVLTGTIIRPLCQGNTNGAINLGVSGGVPPYAFAWSGPNGFTSSTEDLVGIGPGTYTVTVSDGASCSTVRSFNVSAPAELTITTSPSILAFGQNIACSGGNTGSIGLAITGGTAPYGISWTGPNGFIASTANITGLAAGTYTVVVTDANGCATTGQRTMTSPDPLQPTVSGVVGNNCSGELNGTAVAAISGGVPPYSYSWNSTPSQTGTTASGLGTGNYVVTVTDGYGCTSTAPANIPGPVSALSATIGSVVDVTCAGDPTGSATVVITGGTAPYSTSWSTVPPQTGTTASGLMPGPITVTIVDDNGCVASASATISAPVQPLTVSITATTNVSCSGATNGSSTAIASGGVGPYSYSWNNVPSVSGPTLDNVGGGTYTVSVSDANGCSATTSATISEPVTPITLSIASIDPVDCFGGQNGSATVNATGGAAPYTYSWNITPAQVGNTLTNVAGGSYEVTATDANGCTATVSVQIDSPAAGLSVTVPSISNVTCFGDSTGSATALAQGGTTPYIYSWNSDPFQIGAEAVDLPAGAYMVTITDLNGCTAQQSITIEEPSIELLAEFESYSHVSCLGANDGTATITIVGGSGSYSITWDTQPAQTGLTATGLAPGNYTALVTDNNGCATQKQVPVTILGPNAPLEIDLALSNYNGFEVSCPSAEDGSIDLTISGGTAPYTIVWSDTQGNTVGSEDISNLSTDLYTIAVTDAFGCLIDSTIQFTSPSAITVQADITIASCQGASTGAIDITAMGGVGNLQAEWTGPNGFTSGMPDITALQAGIYLLTLSDANGCESMTSFNVNEPGLFLVSASISAYPGGWNVSCADATDGSIDLVVTGGSAPYTFAWTGPNGYFANTEDIIGVGAGTYDLIISDDNGCTTRESYTLEGPEQLIIDLEAGLYGNTELSCMNSNDGSVNATIIGGTPGYLSTWTGPNGYTNTTEDINGLAAGLYNISVADENGCTATSQVTLDAPAAIIISAATSTSTSGDAVPCAGESSGAIALDLSGGTAPFSVSWTGPNGYVASTETISGLIAGTYLATVTDANGCQASLSVDLTAPPALVIDATLSDHNGTGVSCSNGNDGSIDLNLNGGVAPYDISWSGPNAFVSNTEDITGLITGNYTATILDANGCTTTTELQLTAPPVLQVQLALTQAIGCAGASQGALGLSITGGLAPYTTSWSGPNGFTSSEQDLNNLLAGTYVATVTDENGCTAQDTISLSDAAELDLELTASSFSGGVNQPCSGGNGASVDLTISGGTAPFVINWSDGLGYTSSNEDLSGVGAGVYEVSVTDANGCSADQQITLLAPEPVIAGSIISEFNGTSISCANAADGAIDLTISGGVAPYTVQWNTGANSEDLTGLSAGTYGATVTDANGCALVLSYMLEAPPSLDLSITSPTDANGYAVSCAGGSTGELQASVSGGTGSLAFLWSGPGGFTSSDTLLVGLSSGSYQLTATDQNGCTSSGSITLNAPSPIAVELNGLTYNGGSYISCMGGSDGSIAAAIGGGVPTFDVTWSGPNGFTADSTTINDLVAGAYVITVVDGNGCTTDASILLTEPEELEVAILTSDAGSGYQVGCSGTDGSIDLTIAGGTPDHSISWTGPDGFGSQLQNLNALAPGVYTLQITDANGCALERTVTLTQGAPIEAEMVGTSITCPGDTNGSIELTMTSGQAPFTFNWTGPSGIIAATEDLGALASGVYQVDITDALGCSVLLNTEIQGPAPIVSGAYLSFFGQFNLQCAGDSTGVIELSPQGGTGPYTMNLSGPGGYIGAGTDHTGLVAGDYQVSITDVLGCPYDTTITLTQPSQIIDATLDVSIFPSGTNVSCYGAADGSIDATVNGGVGPYAFFWRGPDSLEFSSEDINGLTAGQYAYELVVTDANQCSFFTNITLSQPDTAIHATTILSTYGGGYQVSCPDAADGAIDLSAQGGNGGYQYAWSGPTGSLGQDPDLQGLTSGTYQVVVTDINGCTLTENFILNAPLPMAIDLEALQYPSGSNISCYGRGDGQLAASIAGGVADHGLTWSGPNGFNSTLDLITELLPGEYCLSVIDANNCTAQTCMTITEPEVLTTSLEVTDALCGDANASADLSVSGGSAPYGFLWSNGAATEDLNGVNGGTYEVTITDINGCTVTISATLQSTPGVLATATVTDNNCHGASQGSIDLDVASGSAPFRYEWSSGSTQEDLTDTPAGLYTVTVIDANGCTFTDEYAVNENPALVIDTMVTRSPTGYEISTWLGNDGSISTVVSGGTPDYSWSWSNGSSDANIGNLPAGTYSLQVTDALGCIAAIEITLDQPSDLVMPTGYSPNGDGANDDFRIQGLDAYPSNTMTVINRWGNVVYDRLNYRNDWKGENTEGQDLPNGTYFVILSVNNGARTLQGFVDLRR